MSATLLVGVVIAVGRRMADSGVAAWNQAEQKHVEQELQRELHRAQIEDERAAQKEREAMRRVQERARRSRIAAAQPREWHTAKGALLHKGTLVECDDTIVTVKLDTGETATITIDALSDDDRKYIQLVRDGMR